MFDDPFIIKGKRIFFWSDTHFNHNKEFVWGVRGFKSATEHTDELIHRINSTVKENDILFHLGDFCLNSTWEQFEDIIDKIKCSNIYYISGNHNSRIKQLQKDPSHRLYKKINFLGHYRECIINGQKVVLSHYPIYSWNAMGKESWMIHGHEHGAITNHGPNGTDGKILDVGVDNFKNPVSFQEVKDIMDKKEIRKVGHH